MADKSELRRQILFSDLSDAELGMIAQKISVESFTKGKSIFKE